MQSIKVKVIQLSAELVDYFIANDIFHVDVSLDMAKDHFSITVKGHTDTAPDDLEQLASALTEGRQPEMDEYYDNLVGCEYRDQGYHMMGALVDESEVRFANGVLSVRIRQNGHFTY